MDQTGETAISLNTAAVLTGLSVRTWQRRLEQGLVSRVGADGPALVPLDAVLPAPALSPEDAQALLRADRGDATAQAETGALFALNALKGTRTGASAAGRDSGGGGTPRLRCTSCSRPRHRARPTPCTGWACCTPPDCARMTAGVAAIWR